MDNPRAVLTEIRKQKSRLTRAESFIKRGLRLMAPAAKPVKEKEAPKRKPKRAKRKKHSAPAAAASE